MNKFGKKSKEQLATAESDLRDIAPAVLKIKDHSVIKGHRTEKEQNDAYLNGYSKLPWPKGNHNALPSKAIDVQTYPVPPKTDSTIKELYEYMQNFPAPILLTVLRRLEDQALREEQMYLLGLYKGVASERGIPLRTGADWNRDGNLFDNDFDDLFHIELD